jgi:hypothetical protein
LIKFNKLTGYGEIKLKNADENITYWIMAAAVKIGNSAIQATVVQKEEVKEYIEFVTSMQGKLNVTVKTSASCEEQENR